MSPAACFISDAHLGVRSPGWQSREERLLRFLRAMPSEVSDLVVVGDLFDFWIEYRNLYRSEYFQTLRVLADLRDRGVRLHYVAGNHDFALGPLLTDQVGFLVYPRALSGELLGAHIHVEHGDGVLPSEIPYRVVRALLRSRLNQALYKMLHPTIGIGLAGLASRLSRHGSSGRPLKQTRIEAYRAAAARLLKQTGAEIVVLGHSHTPELCRFAGGTYCNTGEWIHEGSYAMLSEGRIRLWKLDGQEQPGEIQSIES